MGRPLISITRLVGRGLFGRDGACLAVTGPASRPRSAEASLASTPPPRLASS